MKQSNINAKAATTDATAIPAMPAVDNPVLPPAGVAVVVAVVVFVMVAVAVSTAVFVTNRIVGVAVEALVFVASVDTSVEAALEAEVEGEEEEEEAEAVEAVENLDADSSVTEVERSSLWRDDMVMGAGRFPPTRKWSCRQFGTWVRSYHEIFDKCPGTDDGC